MSFTINMPCYVCDKKDKCKDGNKLFKAVVAINRVGEREDEENKGTGWILMSCTNIEVRR